VITIDPAIVRSEFAAYDPKRRHVSDIMSGIGGMGVSGLLGYGMYDQRNNNRA